MIFKTRISSPEASMRSLPALFFLLICILPISLNAQADLSLWGIVSDTETGLPIQNASVNIIPEGIISYTDQNGRFEFFNLKNTEISVLINAAGYSEFHKASISLESDRPDFLKIELSQILYTDPDQVVLTEIEKQSPGKLIITKESPEFKQASTLSDILEFAPGVMLLSSGGSNQTASVSIGGAPAKQTGIYIDGVPVSSNLSGEFDINTIPKQAVERIEIYTSGAGAEMGVGSLAGAVNIITRKASFESDLSFNQQTASFNSALTDLSIQNVFSDKLSGLVIITRNTASNNFLYDDPRLGETKRTNNYRDIYNNFSNLNYALSDISDFYLTYSEIESRAGLPGALYELTAKSNKREYFRQWLLGSELRLTRNLSLNVSIQHHLSYQRFTDYDSFIPYDSKYRDRRAGIDLNSSYTLTTNHALSASLNYQASSFRQSSMIDESSLPIIVDENRIESGLNYNGRFDLSRKPLYLDLLNLNLALKQTSSSLYNPLFSPLVRVDLEKGLGVKLITNFYYSGSYRAPTYASLFWSEDAFSVGNPDLHPEKSEDFGIGLNCFFEWRGRWNLGVEYKHSYVKDLIFWERRFDGKYVPDNLSAAKIETVRWNIGWEMAENLGRISIVYSLADPRDRGWETNNHNQYLTFYPRKIMDFGYHINPSIFMFGVNTRWISERYIRRANTKLLEAYTVTDINFGLKKAIGSFKLSIKGSIENIFSEDYQVIERYPLPHRSYSLTFGLTYNYTSGESYAR